jgi:uncharacterized protein (DUF305 family)
MRRSLTLTLLILLAALLATPAAPASAAPPMVPGMDKMQQQMDQDTAKLQGLGGKDFEIAFLELMIPHHESAVMMAQLVPTRATHPEIKALAQNIITSQQQEIGQMRGWLTSWYGIANPPAMPMAGMDQMMAALQQLTGAEFEQAFLMMMPMHHMGASMMAALAPGRATHPELLRLAQNIVTAQGQEIAQMRGWALAWYGFDPMPMDHGGMTMPGLPNTGGGGMARQAAGFSPALQALVAALAALPVGLLLRRRSARVPR